MRREEGGGLGLHLRTTRKQELMNELFQSESGLGF